MGVQPTGAVLARATRRRGAVFSRLINGASPGAVHDSEFNRHFDKTFSGAAFKKLVLKHVGNTSELAARAITDAILNHGEETHGKFLSFQKVAP